MQTNQYIQPVAAGAAWCNVSSTIVPRILSHADGFVTHPMGSSHAIYALPTINKLT